MPVISSRNASNMIYSYRRSMSWPSLLKGVVLMTNEELALLLAFLQLKCGQESSHFSQERNGRNGSHLEYWFWMYFATTSLLMLPSVLI